MECDVLSLVAGTLLVAQSVSDMVRLEYQGILVVDIIGMEELTFSRRYRSLGAFWPVYNWELVWYLLWI